LESGGSEQRGAKRRRPPRARGAPRCAAPLPRGEVGASLGGSRHLRVKRPRKRRRTCTSINFQRSAWLAS
ncbi:unnamed protein product, partial [Prorocentrum cordatum]